VRLMRGAQRRAFVLQRRLVLAAGAGATAVMASRHLERQRKPLTGCNAPNVTAALESLQTSGVSVVEGVLDAGLVSTVKASAAYQGMPTSEKHNKALKIERGLQHAKEWRLSALGRYHRREEALDTDDIEIFERVEKQIWPLVTAFFGDAQGIYRSEMQILNAVPGSVDQTWHSDNRSRGLSIIVPLVDFTAFNGATQVIVGSHNYTFPMVVTQGAQVVHAPVGAIAAYDSRTYHRGLGNQSDEGRPALIFCYDRTCSPPPGYSGLYGSVAHLAHASLAGILNVASSGWTMGASLRKQEGDA